MFDYRDVVYVNTSTPVVHGIMVLSSTQRPKHHLAIETLVYLRKGNIQWRNLLISLIKSIIQIHLWVSLVYKNAKEKNIPVCCHNKDKYGNEHGIWYKINATNTSLDMDVLNKADKLFFYVLIQ